MVYNLSHTIDRISISYFTLPGTLLDYVNSTRRVYGRVKAFNEWHSTVDRDGQESGSPKRNVKKIHSFQPIRIIICSLPSDHFASIFVPFIFIIRWTIIKSAKVYDSDTWETIETTKILKGRSG